MESTKKIKNFHCQVCFSDEFFEDDSGGYNCIHCGTLSQEFIMETNDIEDGALATMQFGYQIRRKRNTSILPSPKTPSRKKIDSDLLELLSFYQYSMLHLFYAAIELVTQDKELIEKCLQTLKDIWLKYLYAWKESTSECTLAMSFSREGRKCLCQVNKMQHPILLTKAFLLGFICLTFRIHRLDVIPADFVRWAERSLIPYFNLWELTADDIKATIPTKYRWFFVAQHKGDTKLVSTTNIWFHTIKLAECINQPIPSLNSPLIARGIIASLGFPNEVWENYAKITQLFTTAKPLQPLNPIDQQYPEHIMATLVIAYKLSHNWVLWDIKQHTYPSTTSPNSTTNHHSNICAVPNPCTLEELHRIPRKSLSIYLQQIRKLHSFYQFQTFFKQRSSTFRLNKIIIDLVRMHKQHLLDEDHHPTFVKDNSNLLFSLEEIENDIFGVGHDTSESVDDSEIIPQSTMIYTHQMPYDRQLSKKERNYLTSFTQTNQTNSKFQRYISYHRHQQDITGLHHTEYIALIERCARYMYISPSILHTLVDKIDEQISNLVFEGKPKSMTSKRIMQRMKANVMSDRTNDKKSEEDEALIAYADFLGLSSNLIKELGLEALPLNQRKSQLPQDYHDWWKYNNSEEETSEQEEVGDGEREEEEEEGDYDDIDYDNSSEVEISVKEEPRFSDEEDNDGPNQRGMNTYRLSAVKEEDIEDDSSAYSLSHASEASSLPFGV